MQLARLAADAEREEARERLVIAAFIGWQMGAAGKSTFGEHLRKLKLDEEISQYATPKYDKKSSDARLGRMGIKPKKGG